MHIGTRLSPRGRDWLLERTVGTCTNLVTFGTHLFFSDLHFADDVALLAELLELLVPALETLASETASLHNLGNHKSGISISTKLKLYNITCILLIFLYGSLSLSAGQLPREMYTRLMLSINGVCKSC